MSMKASRFSKTRSSRINRERIAQYLLEQEEYFSSFVEARKYSSTSTFQRPGSHETNVNSWYSFQVIAFVIATGDAPFFLTECDPLNEKISIFQSLRKEIWGFDILSVDYELLGEVLQAVGLVFNLEDLTKIVSFVQSLPPNSIFEEWEIKSDWNLYQRTGNISVCLNNPEKSLTTERDSNLKRYSYDVLNLATKEVSEKVGQLPLMGVELEFSSPSCYLDELMPVLALGVFKSDSTTDVEWVSLPLEYTEIKEQMESKASSFDMMLQNNGLESNGMHVHVTKSFLSFAQEARIYYLINARGNRKYWSKVADRDVQNNPYCHFVDLSYSLVEAVKTGDYSSLSDAHFCDDRGVTVNRTKGHTLEFRFFKSPDNVEKVLENLRVVQAILEYTAKGGYNLKGFIKFLKQFDA